MAIFPWITFEVFLTPYVCSQCILICPIKHITYKITVQLTYVFLLHSFSYGTGGRQLTYSHRTTLYIIESVTSHYTFLYSYWGVFLYFVYNVGIITKPILPCIITNIIIVKSRMSLSDSKRSVITGIFPNSFYCILTSPRYAMRNLRARVKAT